MKNEKIFELLWGCFTGGFLEINRQVNEGLERERAENIIYETRDILLSLSIRITGLEFTNEELARINLLVDKFNRDYPRLE